MEPTRRQFLAGAGAAATAGLAGCTDVLSGTTQFNATAAPLSESAQRETRYDLHRTVEAPTTREFGAFGISRRVEVTNVVSEYDRAVELGLLGRRLQAAVFTTLASPKVRLFGREFNPVADMSPAEVANLAQSRYGAVSDVQRAGDPFRADVGGVETTVGRFTADARLLAAGQDVEVYLYVSEAVASGDDYVVALAVHPRAFGRQEGTVRRLLAGVEPGEGEGT